jgi:lipopolysaccharide/colanic/teichoic acid biosynthesis glycosyltransferase
LAAVQIPRLARVLRAKHLDELPQLFLVVAGKMSLVGPRPEMAHLHEATEPTFAAARTTVRPGCTGLWQLSPAGAGLIGEAPEYDLFYLRYASLGLDLWILWRTFRFMLHIAPLLNLSDVPPWALGGRQPHRDELEGAPATASFEAAG